VIDVTVKPNHARTCDVQRLTGEHPEKKGGIPWRAKLPSPPPRLPPRLCFTFPPPGAPHTPKAPTPVEDLPRPRLADHSRVWSVQTLA